MFVLLLPFVWAYEKCTGSDEDPERARIAKIQEEINSNADSARYQALISRTAAARHAEAERTEAAAAAAKLAAQRERASRPGSPTNAWTPSRNASTRPARPVFPMRRYRGRQDRW